jgi:hypothetical protein
MEKLNDDGVVEFAADPSEACALRDLDAFLGVLPKPDVNGIADRL